MAFERFLCIIFFSVFVALLSGCQECETINCNPCIIGKIVPPVCPVQRTCAVELCKEPLQCTIEDRHRTIACLIQQGVKVIQVGETFTIVLPSDLVFNRGSANINPCYLSVLKAVSHLIFCYEKTTVRIAAYTDCSCPPACSTLLTQAQANAVAKNLWCNGIDARLLFAVGYGPRFPIASNNISCVNALNRRIEICFRSIPPYAPDC